MPIVHSTSLWKSVWQSLRKMGIDPHQDPATPLVDIYPKDASSYPSGTCSTMFIAVELIIARSWKQPRCPSIEEWIKKMWYSHCPPPREGWRAHKSSALLGYLSACSPAPWVTNSEPTETVNLAKVSRAWD